MTSTSYEDTKDASRDSSPLPKTAFSLRQALTHDGYRSSGTRPVNKQTTGRRLTNKEIAARLSVTSAAVKKRLESVYAKLDVHTRREAVAAAVARGFIRTPFL